MSDHYRSLGLVLGCAVFGPQFCIFRALNLCICASIMRKADCTEAALDERSPRQRPALYWSSTSAHCLNLSDAVAVGQCCPIAHKVALRIRIYAVHGDTRGLKVMKRLAHCAAYLPLRNSSLPKRTVRSSRYPPCHRGPCLCGRSSRTTSRARGHLQLSRVQQVEAQGAEHRDRARPVPGK